MFGIPPHRIDCKTVALDRQKKMKATKGRVGADQAAASTAKEVEQAAHQKEAESTTAAGGAQKGKPPIHSEGSNIGKKIPPTLLIPSRQIKLPSVKVRVGRSSVGWWGSWPHLLLWRGS